jgi:hypothetical protein
MAAIYLEPLDRRMEATGLTYARFMDDWVILAPTRWSLRPAVVIVNETLRELRVEQHPDQTFIGAGIYVSRLLDYGEGRDWYRALNVGSISRTFGSAL